MIRIPFSNRRELEGNRDKGRPQNGMKFRPRERDSLQDPNYTGSYVARMTFKLWVRIPGTPTTLFRNLFDRYILLLR